MHMMSWYFCTYKKLAVLHLDVILFRIWIYNVLVHVREKESYATVLDLVEMKIGFLVDILPDGNVDSMQILLN